MMQEYKDDSKHKMKIHEHDVCEKAILDSNCCIPPPLMSVNVNVTINRPPLSFVHTSKYSSIIPAGFHEFVDRRFRSICKSIYSPGHAIRLLNVLRRLLHPHQHTHQNPHQNHHQIHHSHQCHPYYLFTILVPSEKKKAWCSLRILGEGRDQPKVKIVEELVESRVKNSVGWNLLRLNMKSVETSEGCGRQGRRRERVKVQQDNSQVLLKDKDQDKDVRVKLSGWEVSQSIRCQKRVE